MSRASRNLFACFKPVVADDHPSFYSPSLSEDKTGVPRKMSVNRTFSRAMKAVFFKTSLVKKIRLREKHVNNMKKNSSYNLFSDKQEIFRTNSNHSSLFTSSSPSSASSVSSNSRSGSLRIKESSSLDDLKQLFHKKIRKHNGDSNSIYSSSTNGILYIIFVCLIAVVFLGKAFAVVACTSTWLLLAPYYDSRSEGVIDSQVNSVVESEEQKKRVIMEGILHRNNRPRVVN